MNSEYTTATSWANEAKPDQVKDISGAIRRNRGNKVNSEHAKYAAISDMVRQDNLDRVNAISKSVNPKDTFYTNYGKRIIDLIITVPVFLLLLPVNMVIGIITFFNVGRPIFFKQARIGKDGKPFDIIKFRNMTNEKDSEGQLLPSCQRVTRFGRFVRKYSLDELLNFWSILKGDMSLIGPRPLPYEFQDRFSQRHRMRCAVRPGLECPSLNTQAHLRLYQEQFENDVWYVENLSFIIDCKMVMHLLKMVFDSINRGDHADGGGGYFVGYNQKNEAFSMRNIPDAYEKRYSQMTHSEIAE